MIFDRGPIGGPGGASLAPVTTLSLSWDWDFTTAGRSRCHGFSQIDFPGLGAVSIRCDPNPNQTWCLIAGQVMP